MLALKVGAEEDKICVAVVIKAKMTGCAYREEWRGEGWSGMEQDKQERVHITDQDMEGSQSCTRKALGIFKGQSRVEALHTERGGGREIVGDNGTGFRNREAFKGSVEKFYIYTCAAG